MEKEIENIVLQAIQNVCNTNTPKRFAEMNNSVYNVAVQSVKDTIARIKTEVERRKYEWQTLLDKNNAIHPDVAKELICEDDNILLAISKLEKEYE